MCKRSLKEQKGPINTQMKLILIKLLISFGLWGTFFVDIWMVTIRHHRPKEVQ